MAEPQLTVAELIRHLQTLPADYPVEAYAAFEEHAPLTIAGVTVVDQSYEPKRGEDGSYGHGWHHVPIAPRVQIIGG